MPQPPVDHLSLAHAQRGIEVAAPGHRVLASTPAGFASTNSVHVIDTVSASGRRRRLVVKLLTDDPRYEACHGRIQRSADRPRSRLAGTGARLPGRRPGTVENAVCGVWFRCGRAASWSRKRATLGP